ncbi:hypothetical protein KBZ20_14235 [Vulcanococcus limneticus Candia 3F8]|uniref:hypothetical protein n=1 Tax=Vulcanococcus limneticus TaxID=2170428 RepID=UPI000B98153D|nr:hypothetical protein [Vulcanococcus limneticus]MCP9793550.1 hypothetical protein [Vulcanococcus limneticus MW73D5]MCP9894930.1 hypothetical protein [Vulcanococcus limneticus Candia 3F8]MCP9898401.1 hypothetical protein [Vulcanococcus limneticus Candia 3B3]
MWLFLPDGFLSIVAVKGEENGPTLLVRARAAGHIEACFPAAEVITTADADYRYRAFVPREQVAAALAEQVRQLSYTNFKNAISSDAYHDAALEAWGVMHRFQGQSCSSASKP